MISTWVLIFALQVRNPIRATTGAVPDSISSPRAAVRQSGRGRAGSPNPCLIMMCDRIVRYGQPEQSHLQPICVHLLPQGVG